MGEAKLKARSVPIFADQILTIVNTMNSVWFAEAAQIIPNWKEKEGERKSFAILFDVRPGFKNPLSDTDNNKNAMWFFNDGFHALMVLIKRNQIRTYPMTGTVEHFHLGEKYHSPITLEPKIPRTDLISENIRRKRAAEMVVKQGTIILNHVIADVRTEDGWGTAISRGRGLIDAGISPNNIKVLPAPPGTPVGWDEADSLPPGMTPLDRIKMADSAIPFNEWLAQKSSIHH
jgi:hypothetical protein